MVRLHQEFMRRIMTQCLLPGANSACMFWAPPASGRVTLRKVDGQQNFHKLDPAGIHH